MITENQRAAFLYDLQQVCEKHGLSLGHEDYQGSFTVEPYSRYNAEWLGQAFIEEPRPPVKYTAPLGPYPVKNDAVDEVFASKLLLGRLNHKGLEDT